MGFHNEITGTPLQAGLQWVLLHNRRASGYAMPSRHFHNEYELYYLCEGQRLYFIRDRLYPVNAGDLVFINSHTIHHTQDVGESPHERYVLNIHPTFLHSWQKKLEGLDFSALLAQPCLIVSLAPDERAAVEQALRQMETARLAGPQERAWAEIKIADLLCLLLQKAGQAGAQAAASQKPAKYKRIDEICEYILANGCRVSLDELCAAFYLSRFYLCRIFKEGSGMTISEFIAANRVLLAEDLLQNTERPITEVAGEVGFGSISQLEKTFRRYMGVTPRKYRQLYRQAPEE